MTNKELTMHLQNKNLFNCGNGEYSPIAKTRWEIIA